MAERIVVCWRDIPAQVIVRAGRRSAKRELPEIFVQAIDRAAMVSGASGSDAYLAEWRRNDPVPCGDDLEAEADRAVAEIITEFDADRLALLAANGGRHA